MQIDNNNALSSNTKVIRAGQRSQEERKNGACILLLLNSQAMVTSRLISNCKQILSVSFVLCLMEWAFMYLYLVSPF